jgi:predicted nucleic acid-binding protein
MNTSGYLLDTSVVNRICNGEVSADPWSPFFITDLVLLELSQAKDSLRRRLMEVLSGRLVLGGILRSEESIRSQHSGTDESHGCYDGALSSVGRAFPLILGTIGISHKQHWKDAFIVQAAMRHGLTLVTADKNQAKGARRCHVSVDFIKRGVPSGQADEKA